MAELLTNFRWAWDGEPQDMLVHNGRVLDRGSQVRVPDGVLRHDLGGAFLMPAFVDNHCHILPTGLDLRKPDLGRLTTRDEVFDVLRDALAELPDGAWLRCVQYDQGHFADGRHITRDELDVLSDRHPIQLRHASGHASVVNTAALRAAEVAEDEPDPEGGSYGRDSAGRLNGLLLEHAHENVTARAPRPSREEMTAAILAAAQSMSAYGIACASDMMTGFFHLEDELAAYREASQTSPVRFRLYVQWGEVFGPRGIGADALHERAADMEPDRCRVAGIKIFADGAISAATAATTFDYPSGGRGQLIYSSERLQTMVRTAHEAGFQIVVHAIGDQAVNEVMDAYESLGDAQRHRIEHVTMLSDAQIERLARIGCFVTMQPEFLKAFRPSYAKQIGPERTARLKRFRSVLDAGCPLSLSSDRPIVSGDPWLAVRYAADRPEGFDPSENLSRHEALIAHTEEAARANEDSAEMGGLRAGQLADWLVIDRNPVEN